MTEPNQTCEGVLGDPDLRELHSKLCDLLLGEQFSRGLNFEKLKTGDESNVYSLRANNCKRFLVTRTLVDNVPWWIALEDLPTHKYKTSRFLKKGYLRDYLERQMPVLKEQAKSGLYNKVLSQSLTPPAPPENKPEEDDIKLTELEYFNDKLLVLNPIQEQALNSKQPLIVTGMPGAGKSVLAQAILLKNLEANGFEGKASRRLYLTSSPELRKSMQDTWMASPSYDPSQPNAMEFKSWEELINELKPETRELHKVGVEEFIQWIPSVLNKFSGLRESLKNHLPPSVDLLQFLYQEFRIMSGYDEKSYRNIGDKHSLFATNHLTKPENNKFRDKLYTLFVKYKSHLSESKFINYAFYNFDVPAIYNQVVVDEAQDLSQHQLNFASSLAKSKQISYFLDTNQSEDYLSKLPWLKKILNGQHIWFHLPFSLRCSKLVIRIANVILSLKNFLTRCKLDKSMSAEIPIPDDAIEGDVIGINEAEDSTLPDKTPVQEASEDGETKSVPALEIIEVKEIAQTQKINSVEFAVIAPKKWIPQARKKFPGAIVLTPRQAKGQEFEEVVAFNLFNNPEFRYLNPLLADYENASKKVFGRAKNGQAHPEYGPILNDVFSAFTRSRNKLYLYNESTYYTSNLDLILEKYITKRIKSTASVGSTLEGSSKELWLERATKFLQREDHRQENEETARAICRVHLEYKEDDFQELLLKVRPKKMVFKESRQKNDCVSRQEEKGAPISQTTSTTSPIQTYELSREQKYLSSLIHDSKNFEAVLLKIFKTDPFKWLFEVALSNGTLLITDIMEDPEKEKLLLEVLGKPKNAKKITPQRLIDTELLCPKGVTTALTYLAWFPDSPKIMETLTKTNPDFLKEITWPQLIKTRKGSENTSILHWLSASDEGCSILLSLLKKDPGLVKKFTLADLTKESEAHYEQGCSPLFWLASSAKGRRILFLIFKENKNLLNEITLSHLTKTNDVFRGAETSVLYWLSCDQEGCDLLDQLIKTNQQVAGKLKSKHFTAPVSAKLKDHKNASALFWLAKNQSLLFLDLIANNEHFLDDLEGMDLSHIRSDNSSVLFNLTGNDVGHNTLVKLLGKKPILPSFITAEALYNSVSTGDIDNGTSSFFWLAAIPNGRKILEKLLKNKKLLDKLTAEDLIRHRGKEAESDENSSALFYLTESLEGRKLLLNLLERKPSLAAGITCEALTRPLLAQADEYENLSPFYWLTKGLTGRKILLKCLDANPRLAKKLTADDLCRFRNKEAGEFENASPLYWLCATVEGQKILYRIVSENAHLAKDLPIESLVRVRTSGKYKGTYPLQKLSETPTGHLILLKLLDKNPLIGHFFASNLVDPASKYEKNKVLCSLSKTPNGCLFLSRLLLSHPFFREELKAALFFKVRIDMNQNTMLFEELHQTAQGKSLLKNILQGSVNPESPIRKIQVRSTRYLNLFKPSLDKDKPLTDNLKPSREILSIN